MKVLDHENNENANSDAYDDPEIIISEKPIFDGSPLTLTMHVIAIITFAMTEHVWKHTCTSEYFDLLALSKAK